MKTIAALTFAFMLAGCLLYSLEPSDKPTLPYAEPHGEVEIKGNPCVYWVMADQSAVVLCEGFVAVLRPDKPNTL